MTKRIYAFILSVSFLFTLVYTGILSPSDVSAATKKVKVSNENEFQQALDSATPGTTIYLKSGTYTGPFTFNKSGNSRGYITVKPYNNDRVIITKKKNENGAAFDMNGQRYIKIKNLKFRNIKGTKVYGILMENGEDHIYIKNCEFSKIVTTNPDDGKSDHSGESNAILLYNSGSKSISKVYITGNKIHDNINGWSENISVTGNCEYIFVNNNTVYNNTNIGIDFYGNSECCSTPSLDQPRNCECVGNTVYNCKSTYASNAGIYVDGAKYIKIKDNTVYDNPYGIEIGSEEWRRFYTDSNRCRGITVENNTIYGNEECGMRIGGYTNDNSTGVVYNCTISNNDFSKGNSQAEIILAKCRKISFSGNKFKNNAKCKDMVEYDSEISRSKITKIVFQ